MAINVLVDWISFTVPISPIGQGKKYTEVEARVHKALLQYLGDYYTELILAGSELTKKGRPPYVFGWRNGAAGVHLWAGEQYEHMTVEFSGLGCQLLWGTEKMMPLLEDVAGRLTRIDIALDILGNTKPEDFVVLRDNKRFSTESCMTSDSGTTCYVGSMKSERYARVYRYKRPHPRHEWLRVEHVFRREQAKAVGHLLLQFGLPSVAASCADVFGWRHDCLQDFHALGYPLNVVRPEREGGKTLYWLVSQVAPAFQRLVTQGTIADPETFLKEYFLPTTDQDKLL